MFLQVTGGVGAVRAYDLSRCCRCPSVQVEQFVQGLLVGGHVGGDAACFGSSAGGGVDQHGFLDAAQGVQEGLHGQVVAGAAGLEAQQVGQLQGQHAGEGVHGDVVVGPVVHRGERHLVGVLELTEAELDL